MRGMLDSTDPFSIPAGYPMVAGYDDGAASSWTRPTLPSGGWARFANSTRVHIAVANFIKGANVYDCEKGDFTISQLVEVIHVARQNGDNPTGYFSTSQWDAVLDAFAVAHEPLPSHGFWVASWPAGFGPADKTIPTATPSGRPALAVAHQYAGSNWEGHNYDASVVADYWPGVDSVPQPPQPIVIPPAPIPESYRIWSFSVTPDDPLRPIGGEMRFSDALQGAQQYIVTHPGSLVDICTEES